MNSFFKNKIKQLFPKAPARATAGKALIPLSGQDESLLQLELFNTQQIEQHGRQLAQTHKTGPVDAPNSLLQRLAENEQIISNTCNLLIKAVQDDVQITPAAEWLLDNFYLIEEQIRTAKRHFPKNYSEGLPRLANGPSIGQPRVYDIALNIIAHGDARVDPDVLHIFLHAYQTIAPLDLGELWAVPIMLRLALIENLRRVAMRTANSHKHRDLANHWADQMIAAADKDPASLILVIADMARSEPPLDSAFIAELVRRLQGQGPSLALPLNWIEQRLSQTGQTIDQIIQAEIQQQAANQVSISNSIGSLRFLGAMNWRKFVETASLVEHVLLQDPTHHYGRMDFTTRDSYRHIIEKIAKHSHLSETAVAHHALRLAQSAYDADPTDMRHAHIGYYVVGKGVRQLEDAAQYHGRWIETIHRAIRHSFPAYIGCIALFAAGVSAWLTQQIALTVTHGLLIAVIAVLGVVVGSQLGVSITNWLATLLARPQYMPRMDFSDGIPDNARTAVVIPTLLMNSQNVDELVQGLEIRFLANRDANLHYCLLSDFTDSPTETKPQDDALIAQASQAIDALNQKYAPLTMDKFFLFHRPRLWNARDKVWMAHERKRGKLGSFNHFLLHQDRTPFNQITGNTEVLAQVKYVITLDTDTQLPPEAAWKLVGAMAHPLNRAHYDTTKQRVTDGYGILQPRVAIGVPSEYGSRYATLAGGEPGIDPYTRTVSDVYQDAFGEGSFIGKGIYDVAVFEQALANRFPDNTILSHDLLEGSYVRSGLISDVQLYEEYPTRYRADVSRWHRWVRGDWQIAGWLLPTVPAINNQRWRNPLSALSVWKIFDNLRRSVVPFALLTLLVLGWLLAVHPVCWTLVLIGLSLLPSVLSLAVALFFKSPDMAVPKHLATLVDNAGHQLAVTGFNLATLPHEAMTKIDAVMRASWRMLVSKRRLLEWNPSATTNRQGKDDIFSTVLNMRFQMLLSVILVAGLAWLQRPSLLIAAPVVLAWLLAPVLIAWLGRPLRYDESHLNETQTIYLHKMARKIWAFFETYVGADDNWLPPDNVQEYPVAVIAHRTSPTNIGMSLLANVSAYDFGYVGIDTIIARTTNTFATLDRMERYKGHFYNWYDTETLQPLLPIYISTVDSGNMAGHLLTLKSGLLALGDDPVVNPQLFNGLRDTVHLLQDALGSHPQPALDHVRDLVTAACAQSPATVQDIALILQQLQPLVTQIATPLDALIDADASLWARALQRQCEAALANLQHFVPWAFETADDLPASARHVPTLKELAHFALALPAEDYDRLASHIDIAGQRAAEALAQLQDLAARAHDFAWMEYDFLYDESKNLLAIGYNLSDQRRDDSFYDLLASEARLTSFVAIAQGQLPQENWFALGRQLTTTGGQPTLLSWSGSMFEYLMPLLVMPTYDKTLLDQTYHSTIQRQIDYGIQANIPWGISESGYYRFDAHLNYQYRAFGVPGLGLKRGLANDLVIAPYASIMSLMVKPEEACTNMQRLSREGFEGTYGLYEAVDYTPARLPRGKSHAVIRSFMVHHQGMSLLSLDYLLRNRPMQKRFEAEPLFQAILLLLQEKIPKATAFYSNNSELSVIRTAVSTTTQTPIRVLDTPHTPMPEVQLLSNGRYHVMVTNSGASYSRWKDLDITRWREDATRDNYGLFCYVRDTETGHVWSTSYQPTLKQPKSYEAIFSEGRAEFRRRDHHFDMHTEIVVSPEDDIELRRTKIVNRSRKSRTIEIISYGEVVLAPHAADAAHPAFSNLFVQTELLTDKNAIICTRRPRSSGEAPPSLFHLLQVQGGQSDDVSFETNRSQFIGRGRNLAQPQAVITGQSLSNSHGSVLDPIMAIRHRVTIPAEKSITIDMVTGAADTRERCLNLIAKYRDNHIADRVLELAWTHSHVILRQLNASEADAQLYTRMANSILYANKAVRAEAATLVKNRRGQSSLWSYAISGDLPIVLLQIKDAQNIDLVRQMLQAHAYWRLKGLSVDLVIWNDDQAVYRQSLQEQILGLIAAGPEAHALDRPGGIFVRAADHIAPEDRILFESIARMIISDTKGTLSEQVGRQPVSGVKVPRLIPILNAYLQQPDDEPDQPAPETILFNGLGGFSPDGREYIITTKPDQRTPAPWSNVIANPYFGTVISENGQSYTWHENAHAFRLTPWHNDPVMDVGGEAFYIRDEETGEFWSPMPRPTYSKHPYTTRHGFGYSVFEHVENGIRSEMWVYVAIDAPVKFYALKLFNQSGRPRKLSVTGYVEWVLGDQREKTAMHVISEIEPQTGALLARNHYNTQFAERTVFFDVDDTNRTITCDRRDFIGRNRNLGHPAALKRVHLSGKVGAGLDPCAAIQVPFTLASDEERDVTFKLGMAGRHGAEAYRFIQRYRGTFAARNALQDVRRYWDETLNTVQVETPDPALNVMANGWLMYQTLACRLWARSGYYQSGGAFGFRDQLQDTMALIHTRPRLMRDHLLLAAAHQFLEGDVQHWWHPPSDRGVRTRCSDDYLWLPLAVAHYVQATGDTGVLDETVGFLEGRLLNPGEESYYDMPGRSPETGTLYEHCVRAIRYGLQFGEHGLPLIGSCDWNDGMDRVGLHGKGESVWLAFFLYDIMQKFQDIARQQQDDAMVTLCQEQSTLLRQNIETNGWDGNWYRRAYFDDGTPLGSAENDECRIDGLSQSWAVLSGAADPQRAQQGMDAVNQHLIRRDHGLIQLLDPPFDKGKLNPGYIRGYVPGVRENGGQYTHAAIWTVMAFAKLNDRARAWELLQMINPLNHARNADEIATYKVEPYVVAADIYAVSPHSGRGGWTWYTGSAGWMYRLIVEYFIGLRREIDHLAFEPCLSPDWPSVTVTYRFYSTSYRITVIQDDTVSGTTIVLDGVTQAGDRLRLIDDETDHTVTVTVGR